MERSRRRAGRSLAVRRQWCDESGGLFDCLGHQWPGGDHGAGGGSGERSEPTVNTATVTGGGDPTVHELHGDDERWPGD